MEDTLQTTIPKTGKTGEYRSSRVTGAETQEKTTVRMSENEEKPELELRDCWRLSENDSKC